jgi:putative Ca2+/H+ antiporter (TMEM165/GDT1 family)
MMLAADHHAALAVFVGAATALVLVAAASALVGDSLYHLLPPPTLHLIAGAVFVVLGALLILRR